MRAPKFHPGRLDHRITRHVRSLVAGSYNEQVETFTPGLTFWAARKDATIGEQARASEIAAQVSVFFTVRYSADTAAIVAQDRIALENGLTYEVIGTRELERNRWLEVQCVSRADKV